MAFDPNNVPKEVYTELADYIMSSIPFDGKSTQGLEDYEADEQQRQEHEVKLTGTMLLSQVTTAFQTELAQYGAENAAEIVECIDWYEDFNENAKETAKQDLIEGSGASDGEAEIDSVGFKVEGDTITVTLEGKVHQQLG